MSTTKMTYADAACAALREAMQADPNVIALGEDLGRGGVFGQYRGLQAEFGGDRIIDTPISESNHGQRRRNGTGGCEADC